MGSPIWAEKTSFKGLSAEEVVRSLKNVKNFAGVLDYSDLDKLVINCYPVSFVVLYKRHWIAFYIDHETVEIFDSAKVIWKKPPAQLINFLCLHSNKTLKINKRFQKDNSNVCGLYVLLFIKLKGRLWKWKKIIKLLSGYSTKSDKFLRKLFICK